MANIKKHLDNIKGALLGKDVRNSIHDAIKQCYDDASVNNDNANMEVKLARGVHNTLNDRLSESDKKQKELSSQLEHKANLNEVVKKGYGTLNDFNEETRKAILENNNIDINYVLGVNNVRNENIADNEINYDKVDFINIYKSINRFNKYAVAEGFQVVHSTGELIESNQGCVTEFIKVLPEDVIRSTSTWEGAFYDSNKNYISGKSFGVSEIVAPLNARYYRETINKGLIDSTIITINNDLPQSYSDYYDNVELRNDFKDVIKNTFSLIKVNANNTDFFKIDKTINLFNKEVVIDNKVVNRKNGELTDHETGCASDFIEIESNTQYVTKGNWEGAFYDLNKNYISGRTFGTTLFTTPSNAHYFRYAIPMTNKNSEMMVKGSTLPSEYINFGNDLLFTKEDYVNSIHKQLHPLYNKKWVVVGDSLTEKNIRTTKNYHHYIAEETGVIVHNMGVGGTGYKRQEEYNKAFYQRIVDIPLDADIITIFGSGNDLGGNVGISKLGSPSDTTTDTICGCMNETLKKLFERIPGAKVGIVLPCPWGNYPPSQENNAMSRYCEALKEVAKRYSIPVLDLYYGSNLRPWDETFKKLYYKRDDGNHVHPDEDGHKILANKFKVFIQNL